MRRQRALACLGVTGTLLLGLAAKGARIEIAPSIDIAPHIDIQIAPHLEIVIANSYEIALRLEEPEAVRGLGGGEASFALCEGTGREHGQRIGEAER